MTIHLSAQPAAGRIVLGSFSRAAIFCLLSLSPSPGQNPPLARAPVNPDYTRYIASAPAGPNMTASGHSLGHRPSPLIPVPGPLNSASQAQAGAGIPATYDLRTQGRLTPVKDQGGCGACWAFSAMGSLESRLMPGEVWDFSENNLKNNHGFSISPCSGGNIDMATAYLARWQGPVNDSEDPYHATDADTSPSGLTTRKHVQEILYIPPRTASTDNTALKQAVMAYGAVDISLWWDDAYYHSSNHTYANPSVNSTNHEVTIVGWDDNYDRTRFKYIPQANGAFIVRNSWGTGWGESGYFYLSYYDAAAAKRYYSMAFSAVGTNTNYSRAYQYDPLGWSSSYGYGSDTAWFANVFTAQGNESVAAVSFYTPTQNSVYTVKVYTNVPGVPTSGTLAGTTSGVIAGPGYHTIALSAAVPLIVGMRFSVVVQLQTPGYLYPIPAESPWPVNNGETAAVGQSYISWNGTTWSDMNYPTFNNANVCLKVFTTGNSGPTGRVLGDFDGNGTPDVVWINESTRQVVVWYMGGSAGTTQLNGNWLYAATGAVGWHAVASGDFDGNGVPDLVWQNDSTHQVTVHYYGGSGGAQDIGWNWLYSTPVSGWHLAAVADFDRNGVPDLIWENDVTQQVVVHYYGGSGGAANLGWNWLYAGSGAVGWHVVAAADFNKDSVPDLVWQNESTRQVIVHYYGGAGGASDIGWNWLWAGTAYGWRVVAAADYNADGVPDLLWQNDTTGQVTIHYYGGTGGATDLGWSWITSGYSLPWTVVN